MDLNRNTLQVWIYLFHAKIEPPKHIFYAMNEANRAYFVINLTLKMSPTDIPKLVSIVEEPPLRVNVKVAHSYSIE